MEHTQKHFTRRAVWGCLCCLPAVLLLALPGCTLRGTTADSPPLDIWGQGSSAQDSAAQDDSAPANSTAGDAETPAGSAADPTGSSAADSAAPDAADAAATAPDPADAPPQGLMYYDPAAYDAAARAGLQQAVAGWQARQQQLEALFTPDATLEWPGGQAVFSADGTALYTRTAPQQPVRSYTVWQTAQDGPARGCFAVSPDAGFDANDGLALLVLPDGVQALHFACGGDLDWAACAAHSAAGADTVTLDTGARRLQFACPGSGLQVTADFAAGQLDWQYDLQPDTLTEILAVYANARYELGCYGGSIGLRDNRTATVQWVGLQQGAADCGFDENGNLYYYGSAAWRVFLAPDYAAPHAMALPLGWIPEEGVTRRLHGVYPLAEGGYAVLFTDSTPAQQLLPADGGRVAVPYRIGLCDAAGALLESYDTDEPLALRQNGYGRVEIFPEWNTLRVHVYGDGEALCVDFAFDLTDKSVTVYPTPAG